MTDEKRIKINIKLDSNEILRNNFKINSNKQIIDLLEFLLSSLQYHIYKVSKIDVYYENEIIGSFGENNFKFDEKIIKFSNNIEKYIFNVITRKKDENGNWEDCKIIENYNRFKEQKRTDYLLEEYLISTRPSITRFNDYLNPILNRPQPNQNTSSFGNILTNYINRINSISGNQNSNNSRRYPNFVINYRNGNVITTQPQLFQHNLREQEDRNEEEIEQEELEEQELEEQELQEQELEEQELQEQELEETNVDYVNRNFIEIQDYETMYNDIRASYFSLASNIFNVSNNIGLNNDVIVVGNKDEIDELKEKKINEKSKKNKECPICLEEFNDEDLVLSIHCEHNFHTNCIKKWLKEYSNKCPLCKEEIISSSYLNN